MAQKPFNTMPKNDSEKMLQILIDTERVADQILQNKHEIIALDKRRQDDREALRNLIKNNEQKVWICVGSLLIKMSKDKAIEMLEKDKIQIDIEINKLRSDQKVLVAQHRDYEFQSPLRGHDLRPLSYNEISAIKANLPF